MSSDDEKDKRKSTLSVGDAPVVMREKKKKNETIELNDVRDSKLTSDSRRNTVLSTASKTNKGRFSVLFNYERDFEIILAEEKKQKALKIHTVSPSRDSIDFALKRVHDSGKLKDITEIQKEKKTRIPTLKDLEEYIPGVTDFFSYFFRLAVLVFCSILYTVIDLVLYNEFFKKDVALYATSVNMIGVCFDFLWKYTNCLRVYPLAIQKRYYKVLWGIVGCSIHIVTLLAIRYPVFDASQKMVCTSDAIFVVGMVFYLVITYTLDYFVMPLVFRRLDPSGKGLIRSKVIAGEIDSPLVFIGSATFFWIICWASLVMASIISRFQGFEIVMEVFLWVPLVGCFILVTLDSDKYLLHNVQHLIFYLWFLYLIPQMTSSILTAFMNLQQTGAKFVLSIIFILLMQFCITTAAKSSSNMGDGGPTVHYVFQVQFFEYFFGALFFVDVKLNVLFWLMLFAQSFWLIFRNSGLGIDLFVWSYHRFIKDILKPLGLIQNLAFDSARQRLYSQARMAVQYTICDFTVLIAIPMQYYISTSYMTEPEIERYSKYFNLTLEEHYNYALIYRFLAVAAVKLGFHILAHALLWYKVRNYNAQSSVYGIPTISFVGLFSEYLKKYWFYFIIIIIFSMKASYIAFSIILSTKTFSDSSEVFASQSDRKLYWLTDLYVFIGYRFSTGDTYCLYPSPPPS